VIDWVDHSGRAV